jgi:thiamine kinase-like enzyme
MVEVSLKDVLKVLGELSIDSYKSHEILPLSDKPVGYLADHFVLKVNLSSTPFIKEFFLKAVPKNVEKREEYLNETGIFRKEVQVYRDLIPKLLKFSRLSWAPKCFLAKDGHYLIMEILRDYKITTNEIFTINLEHLKVAAEALAVMHASSLIFEVKTDCDVLAEYGELLEENAYPSIEGHVRQKGFENGVNVLKELLKMIPKYRDSPDLKKILVEFPKTFRAIFSACQPSQKYKNVITHGDIWTNNFMFRYENGKPVECKFIDFQLARYAPPVFDLVQLVYINSTKELRSHHLDDILNIYSDTFEMELKKAQVDPSILSRLEILESFKEFHLIGLIEASLFSHLTLLPPKMSTSILTSSEEYDKFINQSRVEVCLKAFEEEYYRERMTEILTEIVDTFIIPKLDL